MWKDLVGKIRYLCGDDLTWIQKYVIFISDYSLIIVLAMTSKQENILQAALTLFAEQGYNATSTSKIAKAAGVSEGLIFRHFGSKEGLLNAIMEMGKERAMDAYRTVFTLEDPREIIKATLEIPLQVGEEQYHFWRLIYSLKWQADKYDDSITAPLKKILIDAFVALNYTAPEAEAEAVIMCIDGMAMAVLLRQAKVEQVQQVMLEKYKI